MCRSNRRCPGCNSSEGSRRHNERRRENRRIRRQILEHAEGRSDAPAGLEAYDVPALKAWAAENAPTDVLRLPASRGNSGGQRAPADVGEAETSRGTAAREQVLQTIDNDHVRKKFSALLDSVKGDRPEENVLQGQPVVTEPLTDGKGVNSTMFVTFEDGTKGYFKPVDGANPIVQRIYQCDGQEQAIHEAAAWAMAKRLGSEYESMVAPCIITVQDGRLGSVSLERSGITAKSAKDQEKTFIPADDVVLRAGFFDALTGQQDRHGGNFLMDGEKMTLIDHGLSFKLPGANLGASLFVTLRNSVPAARDLDGREQRLLEELVKSDDALGMAEILGPERTEAMKIRAVKMIFSRKILPPEDL